MKQLKINNPCSEKWKGMKGEGKIRHCENCDYNVVDLTDKSQAELIELVENSEKKTCARVRKSQLDPVKKIAAAVLLGSVLLGCSPKMDEIHSHKKMNYSESFAKFEKDTIYQIQEINGKVAINFSGKVFLDGEGEAIAANVIIINKYGESTSELGTVSEFDGTFSLEGKINIDDYETSFLEISYTGFKSMKISIREVNSHNNMNVFLAIENIIKHDVIILGMIIQEE